MESDSKSDNIVIGPWAGSTKTATKITLSKEDKITNDMNSIDKVAENVMVQLIHTLAENGVDISSVANRGPKEPVVVVPVSIIANRYTGNTPEESMQQFVQDMTANAAAPATEPMPETAMAEAAPPTPVEPTGLGAAPTMDRPPMTA